MRQLILVMLFIIGLESFAFAYDIPPPVQWPKVVEPSDAPSTMSQIGTVIGGVMLAAALLLGGLWLMRKRKGNSTNLT